ncbi:MAG: DUF559 domain-containing protein [Methylibium sp.]|nr:DUF559 domain-containing protein [Methylibium sp.]
MRPAHAPTGPLSRSRERVRARALRQTSPDAERSIWLALRDRRLAGYKFRRQHPLGRYFADFACIEAKLIVGLHANHPHPDPLPQAGEGARPSPAPTPNLPQRGREQTEDSE